MCPSLVWLPSSLSFSSVKPGDFLEASDSGDAFTEMIYMLPRYLQIYVVSLQICVGGARWEEP